LDTSESKAGREEKEGSIELLENLRLGTGRAGRKAILLGGVGGPEGKDLGLPFRRKNAFNWEAICLRGERLAGGEISRNDSYWRGKKRPITKPRGGGG